jgi:hypothetical protein
MELINLTNWILLNLILIVELIIKKISKDKFWYILLSVVSIILLMISLFYGITSALNVNKDINDFLIGGFY